MRAIESEDADIFLAAALLSNAVGKGNVCLDFDSMTKNEFIEEMKGAEQAKFPETSTWLEKLHKSTVVGKPGGFFPLILDEKNRLYLYRYWDYEKKWSDAILKRVQENIENIDYALVKDSFKRLFPLKTGDNNLEQRLAAFMAVF